MLISVVTLIACGPGPVPPPPAAPHFDRHALSDRSDRFPADSDEPFPLDDAIHRGQLGELRRLLENGANPNLRWGSGDHFPLQEIFDTGAGYTPPDPVEAVRLLVEHGADPNARWCPFESRGSDVGGPVCRSAQGTTTLMWAAAAGATEAIDLLLQHGADASAVDWLGNSPLHLATSEVGFELIARAMFPPVDTRDRDSLRWLRREGRAHPISEAELFQSALSWSRYQVPLDVLAPEGPPYSFVRRNELWENRIVERLRILLRLGAKPNGRIDTGNGEWTPLGVALQNGTVRAARILLQAGADVNDRACLATGYDMKLKKQIFPPCARENGTTPLMYAAAKGQTDVVALLSEFKADRSLKDWAGRSALDYAKTDEIRKLLTQ